MDPRHPAHGPGIPGPHPTGYGKCPSGSDSGKIPAIERFVSTLGMLAAIAPLLGLLGTVTGMINTFHVITYYGAGDPKMMSGGISEALVTTMLGLSVAIPIMLFHTLLSRRVETQISQMEEKAVAFVNMVFKARNECCRH